jgi:menaquinone-dependent protoporphyrinogen IX oxidase
MVKKFVGHHKNPLDNQPFAIHFLSHVFVPFISLESSHPQFKSLKISENKLFKHVPSHSIHPETFTKNMVKKFVGHHKNPLDNQPIASHFLSHVCVPFSTLKSSHPQFKSLKISENKPFKHVPSHSILLEIFTKNMVKKFVGHHKNHLDNQPIASHFLSHLCVPFSTLKSSHPQFKSLKISENKPFKHVPSHSILHETIAKNMVKKFVGHPQNNLDNQPFACHFLSHVFVPFRSLLFECIRSSLHSSISMVLPFAR